MGKGNDEIRRSPRTLTVLEPSLDNPGGSLSGADLRQPRGVASGALYSILRRLEAAGWFVSQWAPIESSGGQERPQRRLYRLTSTGLRQASDVSTSCKRGVFA